MCDYCACRAVLPVSWAFSVTGVVCGFVIMVVVAAANAYTSDMLLRQAHHTGSTDYESLALVTGGRWWKVLWFRASESSSPPSLLFFFFFFFFAMHLGLSPFLFALVFVFFFAIFFASCEELRRRC